MNSPTLLLFLAVAIGHFIICLAGWRRGYLATKPLLVPLLLCFYLASAARVDPLVVLALVCGFVGDVALELPHKAKDPAALNPPFLVGLGAFLVGHLFYIVVFFRSIPEWPLPWVGLLLLGAVGILLFALRTLYPHMGPLALPGTAYLLVLLTMAFFAALSALTIPATARLPGALLFLLSDYILARSILFQKGRYTDLMVMLTYLCAQFSLVCSLLM